MRRRSWVTRTAILFVGAVSIGVSAGANAADATDINVTIPAYSSHTGPFFQQAARDFEALHPDVHIRITLVSWQNLFQILTTDIAGGRPPDLSIIGTRWLYDFASQGIAEPLNGYMTPAFKSKFIPVFFGPSTIKGQIMALPVAASVRAMMVNLDVLRRAGVSEPPTTWDELYSDAKKIAAMKGYIGLALQGKGIETDAYYYYALWNFGGQIFLPDGKSGLGQPEAIDAVSFYKKMIDEGLTQPTPTDYSQNETFDLFKQGHVGFVFTYPMLIPQVKAEAPNMHYAVVPIPSEKTHATYGVTDSLMMFRQSKVKKETWEFVTFLYQEKYRAEFDKQEGFLPVMNDVAALPYYQKNPDMKAFAAGLPYAKFAPTVADWEQEADIIVRNLQRAYLGQGSPSADMKETAQEINKVMAQNN
jgi:multiple sugar transport system substrate-binding protein